MSFDKAEFFADVKARLAVAMAPDFVPVPDESILDEGERTRLFKWAQARAKEAREVAIKDVIKHAGARLVSIQLGMAWDPGCTDAGYDLPARLATAKTKAADAATVAELADAAVELLTAALLTLNLE